MLKILEISHEPIKYSDVVNDKGYTDGMIFLINYKGAEDNNFAGELFNQWF
jgi:hypothetical protein